MADEQDTAPAWRYFEHFLNQGDDSVADSIFSPDVSFYYPLGNLSGVGPVKGYIAAVRKAFPDIRFTVEDLFGQDGRVAARWSLVATQSGVFRGKPPTGKVVSVSGNTVFHIRNGRITHVWVAFDPARLASG